MSNGRRGHDKVVYDGLRLYFVVHGTFLVVRDRLRRSAILRGVVVLCVVTPEPLVQPFITHASHRLIWSSSLIVPAVTLKVVLFDTPPQLGILWQAARTG